MVTKFVFPSWIPCSEMMPENDIYVMIYCQDKNYEIATLSKYGNTEKLYWSNEYDFSVGIDYVTHWMELPEPPEENEID